jgi:hypothetical protein
MQAVPLCGLLPGVGASLIDSQPGAMTRCRLTVGRIESIVAVVAIAAVAGTAASPAVVDTPQALVDTGMARLLVARLAVDRRLGDLQRG